MSIPMRAVVAVCGLALISLYAAGTGSYVVPLVGGVAMTVVAFDVVAHRRARRPLVVGDLRPYDWVYVSPTDLYAADGDLYVDGSVMRDKVRTTDRCVQVICLDGGGALLNLDNPLPRDTKRRDTADGRGHDTSGDLRVADIVTSKRR